MLGHTSIVVIVVLIITGLGLLFWIVSMYKKTVQGIVLLRTGYGGAKVFFNAGVIIPVIHRMEFMDISVKKMEIHREGKDGLVCKDNIRADIQVAFFIRVNKSVEDIINVAQTIGCEQAGKQETIENLFRGKFLEAVQEIAARAVLFTKLFEFFFNMVDNCWHSSYFCLVT